MTIEDLEKDFSKLLGNHQLGHLTILVKQGGSSFAYSVNNYHVYVYAPKSENGYMHDLRKMDGIKAVFKDKGCLLVAGMDAARDDKELICVLFGTNKQFEAGLAHFNVNYTKGVKCSKSQ